MQQLPSSENLFNSTEQLYQSSLQLMKNTLQAQELLKQFEKPAMQWQGIFNVGQIFQKWWQEVLTEPVQLSEAYWQWSQDLLQLSNSVQAMLAGQTVQPLVALPENDRRFKAADWFENPSFYFIAQSYLLLVKHALNFIEQHPSKNPKLTRQVNFFAKQYLDALAPTNFIWTNPEIMRQTLLTQGENLTKGAKNFLQDLTRNPGYWQIKMTDLEAFEVGKNIATTKGKVIFQNRLMQLIQYEPTTKKVHQRPLLIVPPWINKYYILDLRENNSLVKWALDQQQTVFMISWVNPDASLQDVGLEDYLFEGILAALAAIQQAIGEEEVNVLGFCIGGTLLAIALAYMAAKNDQRIKSATFLTTLIDFYDPGEIEVFIDEEQVKHLEQQMALTGYLDGRLLMSTFNMLKANDLLWSYYINNYLSGKDPFAFDLLYWNSDSTNLPARMFSEYLRNFYLENRLCHAGSFKIGDVALNISDIKTPAYFLSAEQDHIAPWQTTFAGAQLMQGPLTFILAGSGHIAGVVNSPHNNKYYYRYVKEAQRYTDPQSWLAHSEQEKGSWWPHWSAWLKTYAGPLQASRDPAKGGLKPLQASPGDYVKKRCF